MTLIADSISFQQKKHKILEKIALTFPQGVLNGVVGPNGSGKSTRIKILNRIWRPTSGQVLWKGENLLIKAPQEISQTIAFVPQNPPIAFDFTVEEIVSMGRYLHRNFTGHEKIEQAMLQADVWHLRDRLITQVSTGERQRIYIARALATESPILALDEPTSNLDIRHQLAIWQLLKELAHQGRVVIATLHDLQTADRYCDQVAVLNHGCCVAKGSTDEALSEKVVREVFGVSHKDF